MNHIEDSLIPKLSPAWMQTASGIPFDLLNPRVEDVRREDVVHHLARIARFSGATRGAFVTDQPYMVLQHCVLVMDILSAWGAPPAVVREGGWHECDEPYTGDLTRPLQVAVKVVHELNVANALSYLGDGLLSPERERLAQSMRAAMPDPLQSIRRRVTAVAREALGLPHDEHPLVKRADNVALAIERRDLMAKCPHEWQLAEYAPPSMKIERVYEPVGCVHLFTQRMAVVEQLIEAAK